MENPLPVDTDVEAPTGGVTASDAGVEAPIGGVTVRDAGIEASAGGVTVKGVGVFGTYEHDGVSEDMLRPVSGTPDEDRVANTV